MRAAARSLATTAATTQTQRHRRRRRRRRIFLDPKPLAARARHVRVAVQGNPGEFVQETAETATPADTPVESERRRWSPPEEDVWLRAAAVHRSYGVRDADGGRGLARPR